MYNFSFRFGYQDYTICSGSLAKPENLRIRFFRLCQKKEEVPKNLFRLPQSLPKPGDFTILNQDGYLIRFAVIRKHANFHGV